MKTMFHSIGSGVTILTGVYLIGFCISDNLSLWYLLAGNVLLLLGLDWRFNAHKIKARVTLRKYINDNNMVIEDE